MEAFDFKTTAKSGTASSHSWKRSLQIHISSINIGK
jgi:hypothetical protein